MATITLKKPRSQNLIKPGAKQPAPKPRVQPQSLHPGFSQIPQGIVPTSTLGRKYNIAIRPRRPKELPDIIDYADDLISVGLTILHDRDDRQSQIWLVSRARWMGLRKPDWPDVLFALHSSWPYRNRGQAKIAKPHQGRPPPDMHEFKKKPPTNMDVFLSPSGIELEGYMKFYITAANNEDLVLCSFHS